jgi:PAS domain S-box-containing protein
VDLAAPVVESILAIRTLRADPRAAAVSVLAVAPATADEACRRAAVEAGADALWTLPGRADDAAALLHTLAALTAARRVRPCVCDADAVPRARLLAAEAALADERRRTAEAMRRSPFPTLLHAEDGAILATSDSLHEVTGWTRDDVPDMARWLACIAGPAHDAIVAEVAAFYRDGTPRAHGTYTLRCKDGGVRTWDVTTLALGPGPDGRRIAITAGYDVTERERARAALHRSEALYRELFEHHPYPMWVFDRATFEFLAVNDAATRRYGFTREEFLRMRTHAIRPPEEVARMVATVRERPGGLVGDGPWRHVAKDGEAFDVEITAHEVDFEGRPAALVLALDVTERLRAERALERLNRLYELLSRTDELIVRAKDRVTLLDDVCRLAVEHGGFRVAWVGLVGDDGVVRPVSRAGAAAAIVDVVLEAIASSTGRSSRAPVVRNGFGATHRRPYRGARHRAIARTATEASSARCTSTRTRWGSSAPRSRDPRADGPPDVVRLRRGGARPSGGRRVIGSVVLFRAGPSEGWPVDFVSENVARWGFAARDLVAARTPFLSLVHPDDRPQALEGVGAALAAGTDEFLLTYRLLAADGALRWVEDRTSVVRDERARCRRSAASSRTSRAARGRGDQPSALTSYGAGST